MVKSWIHHFIFTTYNIVLYKSISIKECYAILFYHLKKPLYCLYHTILQYLLYQKTLFLLKYYFLIFLYYLFLTVFFRLAWLNHIFFGFPNSHFFSSLSPLTFGTGSTHKTTHTETHDAPINLSKTITTHTEPHTQTNCYHQQSHTHKHKPPNHQ